MDTNTDLTKEIKKQKTICNKGLVITGLNSVFTGVNFGAMINNPNALNIVATLICASAATYCACLTHKQNKIYKNLKQIQNQQ